MSEAFDNCDECPNELTCALNDECAFEAQKRLARGLSFGFLFSLPLWAAIALIWKGLAHAFTK